ncbi:MAG: glycerophosphodiester phosphodiesterase [Candidatus Kerfeldbacteria bacterium]|nr:glycerophosphodiester phosphodiesterase [Candidatus Kerfeldbacteria bacterium]
MTKPLIIGHRGAAGTHPENTLSSFAAAITSGVPMVECDVHVCKSNQLVVIHDDSVDRTTNGTGPIANLTLSALQQLDAGNGERIPTLDELLQLINHRCSINIELKGVNTALPVAQKITQYIQTHGWSLDQFLVSSFDHPQLRAIKKILPDVNIGVLFSNELPVEPTTYARSMRAYSINPDKKSVTEELVSTAHQAGLKVFTYTVNEPTDYDRVTGCRVDGIFTDFPERYLVQ